MLGSSLSEPGAYSKSWLVVFLPHGQRLSSSISTDGQFPHGNLLSMGGSTSSPLPRSEASPSLVGQKAGGVEITIVGRRLHLLIPLPRESLFLFKADLRATPNCLDAWCHEDAVIIAAEPGGGKIGSGHSAWSRLLPVFRPRGLLRNASMKNVISLQNPH